MFQSLLPNILPYAQVRKMQDAGIEVKLVGDELGEQEDINKGFAKDLWSDLLSNVSSLGYSGTSSDIYSRD